MKQLFLHTFLLLTILSGVHAQRGRVQIQDGTLVTDRGSLLRGARISTDYSDYLPTEEEIAGIKEFGLNTIHLYAECPASCDSVNQKVLAIDSIVNMTERDSLYLVMTIGNCGEEGTFDSAFVNAFWNFYAPRYKDKTHMAYEIMNEPFAWSPPYDSLTIAKERKAYDIIRSHAPETHVLFMTYSASINPDSAVMDIKQLGEGIDWSKASIAAHSSFHFYEDREAFKNILNDSGYAVTFTEFGLHIPEVSYANIALTRIFENESCSYLHFVPISDVINHPELYKDLIESSEIRWDPDFGTWPKSLTGINYKNPYQQIEAGFFDEGKGFIRHTLSTTLGYINNEDYVAYYNYDFEEGPDSLIFECSAGNLAVSSGSIELRLDSVDGILIGTCLIPHTEDWDDYQTFNMSINTIFVGVHKFYFVFKGDHVWDLMNLKSFQFKKNRFNSIGDPSISKALNAPIYPNPANNYIKINTTEGSKLQIYNMQGKLLYEKRLVSSDETVTVAGLASGSYMVKIVSGKQIESGVLIIE